MKKLKLFIFLLLMGIFSISNAQTNVLVTDNNAILPGTTVNDGLFQINRSSSLGLDVINRTALGLNVINEMSFRTGGLWTGSIKTIGNNATDARLSFFTGTNATRGNLIERFSINNDGNFALNFNVATIGYLNFGTVFGINGFGIRSNNGTMEYRHNGAPLGVWTPFPPNAPVGTTVEWWLRNLAGLYIYPQLNPNIRVFDPGQIYGVYYDGATNQYGLYSRTSSAMSPTSAVVGFSDVAGNQTFGYLGYNGPFYAHVYNGRSFNLFGMAVYGLVDDPGRTAVFSRTTANATYAALCSYSDCWISGFFEAKDSDAVYSTRPTLYGQMTIKTDKGGNSSGIRGLGYYWPTTYVSGNTTNGVEAYSITQGNGYAVYARHYLNWSDTGDRFALLAGHTATQNYGAYAQGDANHYSYIGNVSPQANYFYHSETTADGDNQASVFAYRTRALQNDGTGYGYSYTNSAIEGYSYWGDLYSFGVAGHNYNDFTRCGGVLGAQQGGTYWGSLGYKSSASLTYGVYGSSAYANGGGSMTDSYTNIGVAGNGGLLGSWFRGEIYGMIVKGERMGLYVDGKTYTNNVITQMNDNGNNDRIPTYVPTSMTVDIYMKGTGQLVNGKATINFDEKYLSLISDKDPIIVTVTPMGQTNGVYIQEVKSNSFSIVENNVGKSNVTFSWIAIATKKGYENPDNPVEILSNTYDKNINDFMFDENDKTSSGKPMWWDGTKLRFDNPPTIPIIKTETKILTPIDMDKNLTQPIINLMPNKK